MSECNKVCIRKVSNRTGIAPREGNYRDHEEHSALFHRFVDIVRAALIARLISVQYAMKVQQHIH